MLHAHIHRAAGIIERPRLLSLYANGQRPITLIVAPAGYGKTTLAAQFAAAEALPTVWHALSSRQRDPYSLHRAALEAVGRAFPHVAGRRPEEGVGPEALARALADFLASQPGFINYILEDLHEVDGAREAENWATALLEAAPANVRFILTSRTAPVVLPYTAISGPKVLPLNADVLRFTSDETVRLADAVNARPLLAANPAVVEKLNGWPAGLALALQPMGLEPTAAVVSGAPIDYFDSMAAALFAAQAPPMQHFLMRISTLALITPEAMIGVLGLQGAMPRLQEAIDRGLFITPAPGGAVLHSLMRAFLQRTFRARAPEAWAATHAAAAAWFEGRHAIDEAVSHYLEGGHVAEAVSLIDRFARIFFDQGRYEALSQWEAGLAALGAANGWLLYITGIVQVERLAYAAASERLSRALALFQGEGNAEGTVRVHLMQAHIGMLQGDHQAAAAIAEEVLAMPGLPGALEASALRLRGLSALRQGDAERAVAAFEAARPLYARFSDRLALLKLLGDLDVAYRQLGRVAEASECLADVIEACRSAPGQAGLAGALSNFAGLMHQQGMLDLAESYYREALSLATRTGDRRVEAYICWNLGDLARDRGRYDEAMGHYNRALALAGAEEPMVRCGVLLSEALLLRWRATPAEIELVLGEASKIAEAHGLAIEAAMARALAASIAAYFDGPAAAVAQIGGAIDALAARGAVSQLAHALALRALLHLQNRDPASAQTDLDALHTLSKRTPLIFTALVEIGHARPLLDALKKLGPAFRDLHKRAQKAVAKPANIIPIRAFTDEAPTPTYTITARLLGAEQYERDGILIVGKEWQAVSARLLFISLLLEGPQRREAMELKLFPGIRDAQKARNNFNTTVSRARAALGANVILYDDDSTLYMLNPHVPITCDVFTFSKALADARMMPASDPSTRVLWRSAIEAYTGRLLPTLHEEWLVPIADRIDQEYVEGLLRAAEVMQKADQFDFARAWFMQANTMEPEREDIYRDLMRLYRDWDEKAQIQHTYDRVCAMCQREFGSLPSEETTRLYRSLMK